MRNRIDIVKHNSRESQTASNWGGFFRGKSCFELSSVGFCYDDLRRCSRIDIDVSEPYSELGTGLSAKGDQITFKRPKHRQESSNTFQSLPVTARAMLLQKSVKPLHFDNAASQSISYFGWKQVKIWHCLSQKRGIQVAEEVSAAFDYSNRAAAILQYPTAHSDVVAAVGSLSTYDPHHRFCDTRFVSSRSIRGIQANDQCDSCGSSGRNCGHCRPVNSLTYRRYGEVDAHSMTSPLWAGPHSAMARCPEACRA